MLTMKFLITLSLIALQFYYIKTESIDNAINPNLRIVNGDEAIPHSYPYQVALFLKVYGQDNKTFCGGSLLSDTFILSAAHCLANAYEAEVILGAHNVHIIEETQQRFKSKIFYVHKGWKPPSLQNDIAIVRLPRKATFTKEIQPIRLPKLSDQNKSFQFKTATVAGWGQTETHATNISSILLEMESTVALPVVCKAAYFWRIGKDQICLNARKGKSTCYGDSGGPLTILNKDGEPVQQGIVSFIIGFGCEIGWPQVFTKVSKYLLWIYEKTGIPIED